jgi:hypothetical protein
MQITINIEDVHLQKQIAHYISDKNIQVNEFMIELLEHFFQKEEIAKTVENSQRIEGYEPVSKEYELKVEAFMKKNNVKVSF